MMWVALRNRNLVIGTVTKPTKLNAELEAFVVWGSSVLAVQRRDLWETEQEAERVRKEQLAARATLTAERKAAMGEGGVPGVLVGASSPG